MAAGIFAYLFHVYPPSQIWSALRFVQLGVFIPFAVGYFLVIYLTDIFSMTRVLKRFGYDVPFRDIIPARGATYLIMILNYGAAQASFAYYLKKTYRIPIWEALSVFFFMAVVDLYWIVTLAFAGSFFQDYHIKGVALKDFVWLVFGIAVLVFILNYLFWRGPLYRKLEKKNFKILEWIRNKDVFRVFKEATLGDYFRLAWLRLPIHVSLIISMYVVLTMFGVTVPFLAILGNIPLVVLVGTLPITPGGLGTSNAAMIKLLSPHLSGAIFDHGFTPAQLLLAASLLWMFSNYLLKTLFGILCLNFVSKELLNVPPETAPQPVKVP